MSGGQQIGHNDQVIKSLFWLGVKVDGDYSETTGKHCACISRRT